MWRLVGGGGVILYAVKIYLACGLMLEKKLLPLMIELVVILNHLGIIRRICRHVMNFKIPYSSPPQFGYLSSIGTS